jgi:hypothetical protein
MLVGGQSFWIKHEFSYIIHRENEDNFGPILRLGCRGTGEIS